MPSIDRSPDQRDYPSLHLSCSGAPLRITDVETDLHLFTEHVYITPGGRRDFGRLAADAIAHKMAKGDAYTKGRTLVIFSEAI